MRIFLAGLSLALLAACGDNKGDVACCAIEPKATCESELLGAGLTQEQIAIVTGPADKVCPSPALPEARLRSIAAAWPKSCAEAHGSSRLVALDSGSCKSALPDMAHDDYTPPPGVDPQVAATCASRLVTRGLQEEELWLIMHEPAGVCPNMGVTEARIREIIAKDWDAAGCTQYTKEQMLAALNAGQCGGDAG